MEPDIEAARKAIADCRERGDGVLDLGGLGLDDAALRELLPDLIKLPPLKTLNLGLAGEVDLESIVDSSTIDASRGMPSRNALQTFPTELTEAQNQLIFLNLRHNQLAQLPEATGGLAKLQTLLLDNNQLASISGAISSLANLQDLSLDNNRLTTLPEAICSLSKLQNLSLNSNQLAALPEAMSCFTRLETLSLNDNQLSAFPKPSAVLRRC